MIQRSRFYIGLTLLLLGLVPIVAGALNIYPEKPDAFLPGEPGTTVQDLIFVIVQWLLTIVGLLSVLFIVIGGIRYITSAGNEEATESAKKMITNSIIGLVVVILSYVIVVVIINALGP